MIFWALGNFLLFVMSVTHSGGCHCGLIRFQVTTPTADVQAVRCNCTICEKKGFLHLEVEKDQVVIEGAEHLSTYTFGTHTAKHYFCSRCGIASYYIPRSYPQGYSINVNCLDKSTIKTLQIIDFDGRDNYEANLSSSTWAKK